MFLPLLTGVLYTCGDRRISELSTEGPDNVGQILPSAFASHLVELQHKKKAFCSSSCRLQR